MMALRCADDDDLDPMDMYTIEADDGLPLDSEQVKDAARLRYETLVEVNAHLQCCRRPARVRRGVPHQA